MSDVKMVLTIDEVLDYLGIDYADDKVNRNITRAIATADKMLQGSIGANYPIEDARSKELALIIVSDLYDVRGMTTRDNVSNNVRRLVEDMSLQLKLELNSDGTDNDTPGRVSFKAPYIADNGNWYLWDVDTQSYADSGVCARGDLSSEQIEKAVENYLNEHPVNVTETDPTVPDWAKRPNKPTYKADEVGAYSKSEVDTMHTALNVRISQAEQDLESKVNADFVNTAIASSTYTKTEVDNLINSAIGEALEGEY